jgi:hypothetical protein
MSTETSEEYYARRDDFMRYIAFEVNPARLKAGLSEIREHEARECFRIIHDFERGLIPKQPNTNLSRGEPAAGET